MKINLANKEWKYIMILFAISFLVQIFVITQGGEDSPLFTPLIGMMMFFPAIGAIISLVKSKEGLNYLNWKLGNPIYLVLALILPSIITLGSVFFFEYFRLGTNTYFSLHEGQIEISKKTFFLGNGKQSPIFFFFNFLVSGVGFSIITGLFTMGEEIGWRGYLQKKLLEKNSVWKSITFLGLIWGLWHLPTILNGYNYPEYPILGGFILFPLVTIFASFFLAWLTINGKSFWPAVFVHGGVNSIMAVLDSMEFGENKLLSNFIIIGIWAIIGLVAYQLIDKNKIEREINED